MVHSAQRVEALRQVLLGHGSLSSADLLPRGLFGEMPVLGVRALLAQLRCPLVNQTSDAASSSDQGFSVIGILVISVAWFLSTLVHVVPVLRFGISMQQTSCHVHSIVPTEKVSIDTCHFVRLNFLSCCHKARQQY